jgi:F0F1-type ATP synthase delta subunit
MHTTDRIINDVAVQLANKIVECANYKALYEEAQEQLARINNVLESDEALKELFDETAQKLEK